MYPTPPRTEQKSGVFQQRTFRLPYYEDYYGIRNPEEFEEGVADKCESDSDSDDSSLEAIAVSPQPQRPTGRYSRSARAWVTASSSRMSAISISSSDDSSSEGEEQTDQGATVVIDLDEDLTPQDEGYQIMPNLSSKRSVPQAQAKKLKVKKFGLFNPHFGLSEDDMSEVVVEDSDNSVANEEDTEMPSYAPSSRRGKRQGTMHRPADRIPIKQQLAQHPAAKAKAEKAEKRARRLQEAAEKLRARKDRKITKTSKPASRQKPASRAVGPESSKPAVHTTQLRGAIVVVDNRGIDFSAYKRYA